VITRSGGNTFSGSFRENLSNPAWIRETPRQVLNNISNPDLLGRNRPARWEGLHGMTHSTVTLELAGQP